MDLYVILVTTSILPTDELFKLFESILALIQSMSHILDYKGNVYRKW